MHTPLGSSHEWKDVGRQTPAKGVFPTFDGETLLFCTVCANERGVDWCAKEEVMHALRTVWSRPRMRWLVGDFLLMPDHLHFFCAPAADAWTEVERWTSFWKNEWQKEVPGKFKWQRGLFHHRLRSERELQDKVAYMLQNPVRACLVRDASEWPWQGRVHDLRW